MDLFFKTFVVCVTMCMCVRVLSLSMFIIDRCGVVFPNECFKKKICTVRRGFLFICWITFHLQEFQTAAIRKLIEQPEMLESCEC